MNEFPMASALSSIHRSGGGFGDDPSGMRRFVHFLLYVSIGLSLQYICILLYRYGSVDKSDGDIYSMLARKV